MDIPLTRRICNQLAVVSAVTTWSRSFTVGLGTSFGIQIQATSVLGTPSLKIQLEHSVVELASTEQLLTNANYVVPDNFPDIFANLNDKLVHVKSLSPVPTRYCRFKFTDGGSTNPADTLVDIWFVDQESV